MPFRPRTRSSTDAGATSLERTNSDDKFFYETRIPSQVYDGSLTDVLAPPPSHSSGSSTTVSHLSESTNRSVKREPSQSPSPLAKKRKREDDSEDRSLWRTAKAVKTEQGMEPTSPVVINDDLVILAWDKGVQKLIDDYDLSDGVKWEMARLRSLGRITSYADFKRHKLALLRGSNADAADRAARTLLDLPEDDASADTAFAHEKSLLSPWAELDTELATLALDPDAGLGNSAARPGWYGGKVVFPLRIKAIKEAKKGKFEGKVIGWSIVLDHATLGSSTRFARRCGSTAFLRVKVAMDVLRSRSHEMLDLFLKPFVLWDRVFRAFFAKDDNVFLVCTNETMESPRMLRTVDNGRQSLREFVEFHNPLRVGDKQLLCKWASRMALGLSNSVPGPRIDPSDIFETPDIVSTDGSNSDLTDGCGLCNKTLPVMIYHSLALDGVPAAIQFRLGGMKGLLLQEPHSTPSDRPQVTYRPSQLKIRDQPNHPAHLTIDLLRTSRMRTSVSISAEVIRNLEDNGVPRHVLADLFKARINEVMEGLTNWEGPNGMLKLWATLERLGGVLTQRRATEASGEARARGLGGDFDRVEDDADNDDEDSDELGFDAGLQRHSIAWQPDYVSGSPSRLEETVMMLLDSGFTPDNSSICRTKLGEIYKSRARYLTSKIKFTIPQSASAFVVPVDDRRADPCGVLGPNEIHIKCSRPLLKTDDGLETDIVEGDVLITRNPCKVPSDVRKVRAVSHPELAGYVDVIVVSAHPSTVRLLELLAGGDYDGDTCIVIWDKRIVDSFRNSSVKPPQDVHRQFTQDTLTVDAFLKQETHNLESQTTEVQKYLLSNLRDMTVLGMYSTFHEHAIIKYGYAHPQTLRLAQIFNTLMDAAKTGHRITEAAWNGDRNAYKHGVGPRHRELEKSRRREDNKPTNLQKAYLVREFDRTQKYHRGNRTEVMDELVGVANEVHSALMKTMDKKFKELSLGNIQQNIPPDMDLAKPWLEATTRASTVGPLAHDLAMIEDHVRKVYNTKGHVKTEKRIEERQDQLRLLSKTFVSGPPLQEMRVIFEESYIRRLAASCAYVHDWREQANRKNVVGDGCTRFPWNVAFRELCHIKAAAVGPSKTVTTTFYEHFKLAKV
ncbi:RNA dependent RNA polymerase-domain-containing protein [Schizophyllum commune]